MEEEEAEPIAELEPVSKPDEEDESKRVNEDETSKSSESQDNGDGITCTICMEEWTIGSGHRVTCLKCGHLFGRSCIERWIKEKGSSAKCPNCNKPARKVDLRDIWCKSVKANDMTELLNLRTALENERRLRKTDSATIFSNSIKISMYLEEIEKMKRAIRERDEKIHRLQTVFDRFNQSRTERLAAANNQGDISMIQEQNDISRISADQDVIDIECEPVQVKGMFHLSERIESSSTGGCRSLALCPIACIVLLAQPSPSNTRSVFGGFGLRKYSTIDTNVREFIPLHQKIITSLQLKPVGDLILTSSLDRKVRLTSINNNACVQSYECDHDPVCVAWSSHRDQQFYVASGNCYVSLYDIRNTSEYIYQTTQKIANSRILSTASTMCEDSLSGLLVNDAKGCQFLELSESSNYDSEQIDRSAEHLKSHQLPFEGLMATVDYDKKNDIALISTRRSASVPNCSHNLVRLRRTQDDRVDCQSLKTFVGGRSGELLTHSRILKHPTVNDGILVGACDDESRGIKLWDSSDNTEYQTIKTDTFVRDMVLYNPDNTNEHYLYALSEKGLIIYRWDYA